MIHLENVSFQYGPNHQVFSNLNLTIYDSSWTVICGPDGSGKTTLGKLIKGLLKPCSGFVKIKLPQEDKKPGVGYISGDYSSSIVGITVVDDICFGMENIRTPQVEMHKRLKEVLNAVGLNGYENRLTHTLSGGERQKLALAGILAMKARILVLDEAFSMLDWISREKLRSLIQSLKNQLNFAVIEITNQASDISTADMIVFLDRKGVPQFEGTREHFLFSSKAQEWMTPQGGVNALLALFPEDIVEEAHAFLKKLNVF